MDARAADDVGEQAARAGGRLLHGGGDAPGRAVELLGRVGLVSYGLVHLLVAWLALQIAVGGRAAGGSGVEADQQGAVGTIAAQPFGTALLVVIALGLVAFAVWQLCAAAVGFGRYSGGEKLRKRVGAAAKAIAVLAIAAVVLRFLFTGRNSSGNQAPQAFTAQLLMLPGGRVLVMLLALVVLVIAGAMVFTGVRRTFMDDLEETTLPGGGRRATELAGVIGHLARAVAFAVIGVLLALAALRSDPGRAGGLDAALRTLAGQPFGITLLMLVALGFAAFGIFCFADARARRARQ